MLWFAAPASAARLADCMPSPAPVAVFVGGTGDLLGSALAGGLDVDGDAVEDLAVGVPEHISSVPTRGRVSVVCGSASGGSTAEPAGFCLVADSPWYPADLGADVALVPDLDGDGRAEVLAGAPDVREGDRYGLAWLIPGGGAEPVEISLQGPRGGLRVGSGDLDGDGLVDLVISGDGGTEVAFGLGGLAFGEATLVTAASLVEVAGDLDGDGTDDLVALERYLPADQAGWWLPGGGAARPIAELGLRADAYSLVMPVGDLDRDGLADLVLFGGDGFGLFLGSPTGPAHLATYSGPEWSTPGSFRRAVGADWDGDGDQELVLLLGDEARVYDVGSVGLLEPPLATFSVPCASWTLASTDLDGDGRDEVAVGMTTVDLPDAVLAGAVWILSSTPSEGTPPGMTGLLDPPDEPIPGQGIDREPQARRCSTGPGGAAGGLLAWVSVAAVARRGRSRAR